MPAFDEHADAELQHEDEPEADVWLAAGDGCDEPEEEDDEFAMAQEHLEPADVVGRIEEFVAEYLQELTTSRTLPPLRLAARSRRNAKFADQGAGVVAVVGAGVQTRCMLANKAAAAQPYLRVFVVLQAVHEVLRSGRTTTQRDLYYRLLRPPLFTAPRDIDSAVQDVVALLHVPRACLGLTCASKGAVAGLVHVRDSPTAPWQDCSAPGTAGKAIPGDLAAVRALGLRVHANARYLLVVEKDAVFQRLVQDQVELQVPCVMVTAKGMPDLATRAFCARLVAEAPRLLPLGLVDYNPHGALILRTWRMGSHRMGLESHQYALPSLRWLGLRGAWLVDVDVRHLQPMTARDEAVLRGLQRSLRHASAATAADDDERVEQAGDLGAWVEELETMGTIGYKADLESVYSVSGYEGLRDMVADMVARRQYI